MQPGRSAAQESHHVHQTSAQNGIDAAAIAQKSVHSRQQHSSVLPKNNRVAATTKQQRRKNTRYENDSPTSCGTALQPNIVSEHARPRSSRTSSASKQHRAPVEHRRRASETALQPNIVGEQASKTALQSNIVDEQVNETAL
uniref:Uncharacterized protein n=1 Tax=Plectus sambesii TaxID=2011161 RepID=A0A914VVZ0_9BILA